MKEIKFEIKNHSDRMAMIQVLRNNGYETYIKSDTSYMPTKMFVVVYVKEE